jgi:single-strand DNA-binding protein
VWGTYGENVAASLNKGDRVVVKGRLEFRKYENKEGVEVTTHDIQADEVAVSLKFATATVERTKRGDNGGTPAPSGSSAPRSAGRPADPVYGDEEPF